MPSFIFKQLPDQAQELDGWSGGFYNRAPYAFWDRRCLVSVTYQRQN